MRVLKTAPEKSISPLVVMSELCPKQAPHQAQSCTVLPYQHVDHLNLKIL